MNTFNKYGFLEDMRTQMLQEILNENISDISEAHDFQPELLDNACIYYSDCFDICQSLGFTDWSNNEFGELTNISQCAYVALQEWVGDEFDMSFIEKAIENRGAFIEFSHSDNCINVEGGKTKTQCTQYDKEFTYVELFEYFVKEYCN